MRAVALLALILAACGPADFGPCRFHFCRYDPPDGGACHSGPAICCGNEDLAVSPPDEACPPGATETTSDGIQTCIDDQPIHGGCS